MLEVLRSPYLQRPEAVIFDCDGLLMDTEVCWSVAEKTIFERRGLPFGPTEKKLLIGKSIGDAGDVLANLFDERNTGPRIANELLELVEDVVSASAAPMPGALELVTRVAKVCNIAVASNSTRSLLEAALKRSGFRNTFEIAICAEDVKYPKPDPEMYLLACARLGVTPSTAIAFEDSYTGATSARAAGLFVVGVPSIDKFGALPCDLEFVSLRDPGLNSLISAWEDGSQSCEVRIND